MRGDLAWLAELVNETRCVCLHGVMTSRVIRGEGERNVRCFLLLRKFASSLIGAQLLSALGTMGNCSSTRERLANIDLSTAKGGMQASQTVGQGGPAAKQDCFILKERCLAAGSPNRLPPLAPQHVATLAC